MQQKNIDAVRKEVDDVAALGEKLLSLASRSDSELGGSQLAEVMMWVTRVGQLIRKLHPPNSAHEQIYKHASNVKGFNFIHSNNHAHIGEIQGVARAIQHEVASGLLLDIRRLLQADIFADFLDMGEHLLNEGYKDAAAVIVGGVLEDSLRKLAQSNSVATTDAKGKPLTIDPLNIALAKAGVYGPLVQKQITSWADLRNNAAHAQYSKYSDGDVKQMLQFVQKFCSDYLQ